MYSSEFMLEFLRSRSFSASMRARVCSCFGDLAVQRVYLQEADGMADPT